MRIGLLTTSKIGHFCSKSQICGKMDDAKKASVFKLRIAGAITMVIVLKHDIHDEDKQSLKGFLESRGFRVREIVGEEETIIGAVGLASIDLREVEILPGVNRVIPISKPYKMASREFKKSDTVVSIGPVKIGGMRIAVIAGPCSVESRDQVLETAKLVRESGGVMLRGGAFKPRTSPYAFQGLGEEGLKLLKEAGEKEGMPVVSEIVGTDYADLMRDYVDVYQVGTRNMQNFELLKRIGGMGKPVLLKRGFAATIEDLLMAAEYLSFSVSAASAPLKPIPGTHWIFPPYR